MVYQRCIAPRATIESFDDTSGIILPTWVDAYRPRYLKFPKNGRVFVTPQKKMAMRHARLILRDLRRDCCEMEEQEPTRYMLAVLWRV